VGWYFISLRITNIEPPLATDTEQEKNKKKISQYGREVAAKYINKREQECRGRGVGIAAESESTRTDPTQPTTSV
jgi:hypothetical protein